MRRIAVSFSGGRTSAYMSYLLKQRSAAELRFVFMNTGQEHEKTLEFVQACDEAWDLGVVWIEADVNPAIGEGTGYRQVDFASASRRGEPFEAVIAKYGISNRTAPHCTRETKQRPWLAYLREIGWTKAEKAMGIRADEIDRMQHDAEAKQVIYPLISDWPTDKAAVMRFWEAQSFDLGLPEILGNCTWCWKKTLRKHLTLAQQHPEVFEFPRRMEALHARTGAVANKTDQDQVFFRGRLSVDDIFELAKQPFEPWAEEHQYDLFNEFDQPDGCTESCEVEL